MPVNSVGIVTARDALTIHFTRDDAWRTVQDFAVLPAEDAREKYQLGEDAQDWKVGLAQQDLKRSGLTESGLTEILYRPFDVRHTYYTGKPSGFHCRPRGEVMREILQENVALISIRQVALDEAWSHALVASCLTDNRSFYSNKRIMSHHPLWLYPREKQDLLDDAPAEKCANFAPGFLAALKKKIGVLPLTPEDVFAYLYAVLYAPSYRARYAEFLKRDFPRIPLTSDRALFKGLVELGQQLVELHLMRRHVAAVCRYPVAGSNRMDKVAFREGRVYINAEQYFDGVPQAVWDYHIGGYQVAAKWLKDRKGRLLSFDDLQHYQRVIAALAETIHLQAEIDAAIPAWPMQ